MTTPETQDVWRECGRSSIRYIFTRFLILLAASAPLGLALGFLSGLWFESILFSFQSVPFTLIGVWLLKRRRDEVKSRGEIIWDFGPVPGREVWVILAYMMLIGLIPMLVVTVIILFQGTLFRGEEVSILNPFLVFLGGVCLYILVTTRLLFCSNGIWAYHTLLRWDMLEYFEWRKSDEWKHSALWVKYRRPAVGPLKAILHIPNESKEEVEEMLRQRCPAISHKVEEIEAETSSV